MTRVDAGPGAVLGAGEKGRLDVSAARGGAGGAKVSGAKVSGVRPWGEANASRSRFGEGVGQGERARSTARQPARTIRRAPLLIMSNV